MRMIFRDLMSSTGSRLVVCMPLPGGTLLCAVDFLRWWRLLKLIWGIVWVTVSPLFHIYIPVHPSAFLLAALAPLAFVFD